MAVPFSPLPGHRGRFTSAGSPLDNILIITDDKLQD
jgi:hypothetical protein